MLYYAQTSLFSLLILLLIYFNINSDLNKSKLDFKLFKALVISTALVTIFDYLMYLFNMQSGELFMIANKFVTLIYYILNPIPCLIWSFYADTLIFKDDSRFKNLFIPLIIPTLIMTVLSLISLFYGVFFHIDATNQYHRGGFNWILFMVCYLYLGYTFIMILKNRNRISSKDLFPMLFFLLPPTIGGLIQMAFQGVSVLWMSVTFSILVVYINIQNVNTSTDFLTGLYNRRQLDAHMHRFIRLQSSGQKIAGILIDLNDMKYINDSFGHLMGDIALEQTALILKKSFHKDAFIARYGGDEFVILFMIKEDDHLLNTTALINSNLALFNNSRKCPFTLSFSIGYDLYDPEKNDTLDDFIKSLDEKMYLAKQKYHEQHDKGRI